MLRTIVLEDGQCFDEALLARSTVISADTLATVQTIIDDVRAQGDEAIRKYTLSFDNCNLLDFKVPDDMLNAALKGSDPEVVKALRHAAARIYDFQKKSCPQSTFNVRTDGSMIGTKVTALNTVGFYVPGGRAQYPSTVLMNVIPAKVAGVRRVIMCTPPNEKGSIDQTTLAAAAIAGVDEVYACGGAQAIAGMAYGTTTIPRCDKIVGPGNIFVAAAKKLVDGDCGIDMIAGPSEVLILADETAQPTFIACDMMAQAEHDPQASTYLITTDPELVDEVEAEIERLLEDAPRAEIITSSLGDNGLAVICPDLSSAIATANLIAPEHLEIQMEEPLELLGLIENAGAIFLGPWSVEAAGDYIAGPSHTLPTSGTARFSSPLSVETFIKRTSVISYSLSALAADADTITTIADEEGLDAHARSVRERIAFVESVE